MERSWYSWEGNTLILRVRVQPRSSRNAITGPHGEHLKICLTSAPIEGKANRDLMKFLAGECKVAPGRVELTSGARGRNKTIRIERPRQLPQGVDPPGSEPSQDIAAHRISRS